jgi:hypothetical protein
MLSGWLGIAVGFGFCSLVYWTATEALRDHEDVAVWQILLLIVFQIIPCALVVAWYVRNH